VTARIAILLNPRSGSAPEREALAQALAKAGLSADIHVVPDARVAGWITSIANGYETLVAAGGDGTISTVAGAVLKAGKTLGVIPAGTSNHFARDLGIPAPLEGAIAVLAAGSTSLVDVGMVNDRTFLNNASIGAYPRMVWERNKARQRGLPRPIASSIAVIDTWLELRNITVRLCIDRHELVRRSPFVVVGNGAYEVEGLQLGRRQTLADGTLSLYVAPGLGRVDALALPVRAFLGRLKQHQKFEAWRATTVTLDTSQTTVSVALDGEIDVIETPLRFSVRPRAVRAIVPKEKAG
jgi:YegS/Rv2252/BmrU family lipid kinase